MLYIASGPALMRDAGHRQARKRKNNKGTPIIPYKKSHKDYPSRDLGAWENVFLFTPIRDKSMLKINEKKVYLIRLYQNRRTWMSAFKFMLHQMLFRVWVIWRSLNTIPKDLLGINRRCIVVYRVTHFRIYDNPT